MAASPNPTSSSLELSLSTTHPSSSGDDHMVKDLDLNQIPKTEEEDQDVEKDEQRRKKLRLTKEQSHLLEESFRQNHILTIKKKQELSTLLNLTPRQVEVWFQNRRARNKLKHTEMECEYLKRCFGSLTEQNRRLQLEIEELRGLNSKTIKARSSDTTEPGSGSGLTMCSRCERVMATAVEERSALSSQSQSQSRMTTSSSSSHS